MTSPFALLAILTGLVAVLYQLEKHPFTARLFGFLPLPFWCYMIPMAAATAGWLPLSNPLYPFFSRHLLPVCLLLLLIPADLKGIVRLGRLSFLLMGLGAAGTIVGGLISFQFHKGILPSGSWAAIGALSATWIGGSANLVAVKEALGTSDSLMGPVIVVDALITYSWMALLIWGSSQQNRWDRWMSRSSGAPSDHHSDRPSEAVLTSTSGSARPALGRDTLPAPPPDDARMGPPFALISQITVVILLSVGVSLGAQSVAGWLPTVGQVITSSTWTILLITSAGIFISLLPIASLKTPLLSRTGTFLLFLLLTSIGARGNLRAIFETPVFLSLGLVWIGIHGMFLLIGGYFLRAPLGLIASASQASIGGVISGPIVGATYHPKLATAALLMAILGNCVGTYLGVLTASLAKLIGS